MNLTTDLTSNMSPKEYLEQYRICRRKYNGLLNNIKELEALAEKTTRTLNGDRVQGHSSDRVGSIGAVIADAKTDAEKELVVLFLKMHEIQTAVCAVQDDVFRELLTLRYIEDLNLNTVANQMGYSYDWARQLHGKALKCLNYTQ